MSDGALTADLASAISALETTLAANPSPTTADTATLSTMQAQVAAAQDIADEVFEFFDGMLASAGAPTNFASGINPAAMAANVNALMVYSAGIVSAFDCVNKLGRMAINLAQIGS